MQYFDQYTALFGTLDEHSIVLTPNQRLSRFVVQQHALFAQRDANVWPRLSCLSLPVWIEQLWSRVRRRGMHPAAMRTELSPVQEQALWQAIVTEHTKGYELLAPKKMAETAAEAWQYLHLWQLTIDDIPDDTEEAVLCKAWMRAYQTRCESLEKIDVHTVCRAVIESATLALLAPCQKIVMLGFDEIPPQHQALLDTANALGVLVRACDIRLESDVKQLPLLDHEQELQSAALWAQSVLQSFLPQKDNSQKLPPSLDPSQSTIDKNSDDDGRDDDFPVIGIVVPDLAQHRLDVERVFQRVFEPQMLLPFSPRHAPPFNISAAINLSDAPIIRAALGALSVVNGKSSRDVISRFLQSPFFSGEDDWTARATIDSLCRQRHTELSLHTLIAIVSECIAPDDSEPLALFAQLNAVKDLSRSNSHRKSKDVDEMRDDNHDDNRPFSNIKSAGEWAALFQQQLDALAWPGERRLDTLEFQQLQLWPRVLETFTGLDSVNQKMTAGEALSFLMSCASVPFQAQTKPSPIQILGLLEAAGQQFDYLWVANMDSRHWPEIPSPNSLLPIQFQREQAMPRSSVDKELRYAQRLTARLQHSAKTVIFSWPSTEGDQLLHASPLIDALPVISYESLDLLESVSYKNRLYRDAQSQGLCFEHIADFCAPPIPRGQTSGGTQIIKDQAACSFRAFACHRLYAVLDADAEHGINGLQKGNLIHLSLEIIWAQLKTQAALLALDEASLMRLVDTALDTAWAQVMPSQLQGQRLKSLEKARAGQLLCAWLALEKKRPEFDVAFNEAEKKIVLAGLGMTIRFDRVDRLIADGSLAVIDYKTAEVDPKDWAGDRPNEPQVPIYCVAQADEVRAAAYGQLHAKGVAFKGVTDTNNSPSGLVAPSELKRLDLPDTWPGILTYWKTVLERLATEYLDGHAAVKPKQPSTSCRFCDLHRVCRIREISEQRIANARVNQAGESGGRDD